MAVLQFTLTQEYIQLNQLLKVMSWAMSGGEANAIIDEGLVSVNGIIETRRRNKIYKGFIVKYGSDSVEIL